MRALSVQAVTKHLGGRTLFEDISFTLTEKDRTALIGRNGYGKSTLLKILGGMLPPDEGDVVVSPNLRLGFLPQTTNYSESTQTVAEIIEATNATPGKVHEVLNVAGFKNINAPASSLSGGWQKRLAFAKMLALEPDFLLLDEPTNHLDFAGLDWLSNALTRFPGGYLVVSHDRRLLSDACEYFLELSKLGMFEVRGSFDEYKQKRDEYRQELQRHHAKLKNKSRYETEWLRAGVKARTTKSKSRIDSAHEINKAASELGKALAQEQDVSFEFQTSDHLSKELLVARDVTRENRIEALPELRLTPKRRIGIVGPNGCGKSSILKILTEELEPDSGKVIKGSSVNISVFDQHKANLDPELTVEEILQQSGQYISFAGQKISIFSWAQRFSFERSQLRSKVSELSGGEQARLLLALVMSQPADVLLLDEPTNDLDIFAREALDEALSSFPGAVAVISHDRYLIDSVCTDVLGFTKKGCATLFGSFNQWQEHLNSLEKNVIEKKKKAKPKFKKAKISYKQEKELKSLEREISKKETRLSEVEALLAQPESPEQAAELGLEYEEVNQQLEQLMDDWAELEALKE